MIDTPTAVRVAVAVAREWGLRVAEPVVLRDSYNVLVHLRPAPVVARVPTVTRLGRARPEEALRRELDVVSFLAGRGFPVVPPSEEVAGGPGGVLSRVRGARPGARDDSGRGGSALVGLHEALGGYLVELPVYGPVLDETARLLNVLEGVVPGEALGRLRAAHARLAGDLPRAGLRVVHGDAHAGNLLATAGGLLWNDFEECMLAPAGWDLAVLRDAGRVDGRAAVVAYGADPGDPGLEVFRRARGLQAVVWQLAKGLRFPGAGAAALEGWLREGEG
ncbi:aminoglycoside phosphotransferase family protein [Nonomuraea sp. NPDC048826]|uniref:aminoglycoside phosphotransferase family protein n=1 Tax=Nonomuraea sp. NPDC048826 TaxID=3364347 RepID=UPI0037149A91